MFRKFGKRVLQSVEHLGQKPRAELDAHQLSGELHDIADLDSVGHLVDLHAGTAVADAYYFPFEALSFDEDVSHLVLPDRAGKAHVSEVSVNTGHVPFYNFHKNLLL